MKLFLASRTIHPKSLIALDTFVGDLRSKKIMYIPTAANGEERYGHWQAGESWQKVNSLNAEITLCVLEETSQPKLEELLPKQEIVWIGGGLAGYLMYWIKRRNFDGAINSFLKNGGVYVGSSAGSQITGPNLSVTEWYIDEPEPHANLYPSLNLVDFDIYPHYQPSQLNQIKNLYTNQKMYLLEDGDAVRVQDNQITTIFPHTPIFEPD